MKKRWLLVLGPVAVLALGVAWSLWSRNPIGPANFNRIQLGMTLEEIETLFGLPNGDICPSGSFADYPRGNKYVGRKNKWLDRRWGPTVHLIGEFGIPYGEVGGWLDSTKDLNRFARGWFGNDFAIGVAFDENGAAAGYYLCELEDSRGMRDRLCDLLGF